MPRYFFHVHDDTIIKDFVGVALSSPEEAKREAAHAGEIAKVLLSDKAFRIVVTDESQQVVCEFATPSP